MADKKLKIMLFFQDSGLLSIVKKKKKERQKMLYLK